MLLGACPLSHGQRGGHGPGHAQLWAAGPQAAPVTGSWTFAKSPKAHPAACQVDPRSRQRLCSWPRPNCPVQAELQMRSRERLEISRQALVIGQRAWPPCGRRLSLSRIGPQGGCCMTPGSPRLIYQPEHIHGEPGRTQAEKSQAQKVLDDPMIRASELIKGGELISLTRTRRAALRRLDPGFAGPTAASWSRPARRCSPRDRAQGP